MPRTKAAKTEKPVKSKDAATPTSPTAGPGAGVELLPLPRMVHTSRPEDYTFFYTTKHVYGWLSQWQPTSFTSTIVLPASSKDGTSESVEVTFPTTEHWMMLHKAVLFNDLEIAREIISLCASPNPQTDKPALLHVKRLGRRVANFSEETWRNHRSKIVVEGNLLKYQQNADLKGKLLATGETMIVEASPRDKVWGIGRGEKRAIADVKAGKGGEGWGGNLLGRALGEVRRRLREAEAKDDKQ